MVSSASNGSSSKTREIDGLLAGCGYKVRLSELPQVAQNIERLQHVFDNSSSDDISQLASDTILYDPSDMGSCLDTLLSEFVDQTISLPYDLPELPEDQNQQQLQLTLVASVEEDSGIKLVHMLMMCAESVIKLMCIS